MSLMNTTYESLKARKVFIFRYLSFLEATDISCSVELSVKALGLLACKPQKIGLLKMKL